MFVGTLVERDFRTGRFEIEQVRAGDETPFSVGGLIDVRYGIDVEYLEVGTEYLVSARRDPVIGLLASKIRDPAPLLGGDDVVGVAESDVECPRLDDPIRTLMPDGSSIDSAVLAPLSEHTTQLLGAILIPLAVAFGIIFVLATLRWGVTDCSAAVGVRRERRAIRHGLTDGAGERLDRAAPVVDGDLLGGLDRHGNGRAHHRPPARRARARSPRRRPRAAGGSGRPVRRACRCRSIGRSCSRR